MRVYPLLFGFLAIACLTFYIFQQRSALPQKTAADALKIGIMTPYFPYATINNAGNFEGFDIAIAQELGKRLSRTIIFEDMPLASLLLALKQNKVDLVLSGLSITQERQSALTMIYYYGEPVRTFPLLFWQKKPAGTQSLADLAARPDTVICVEPGSSQEQFIKNEYPELSLSYLPAIADIIMALKYGKVTAALVDPEIMPALLKKMPNQFNILEVELPAQFQSQGVGIAVNKNNRSLDKLLAQTVQQMQQDGTIKRLALEWFKD